MSYTKKKTRVASSSRNVLASSPQASISHSRSWKAYEEAAVGQSWVDGWWSNFMSETVPLGEWKDNFRMRRENFLRLCNELRPFIKRQTTVMRAPV